MYQNLILFSYSYRFPYRTTTILTLSELENRKSFRDWSLIMGRGGATKRDGGGGQKKSYPYEKGGREKF